MQPSEDAKSGLKFLIACIIGLIGVVGAVWLFGTLLPGPAQMMVVLTFIGWCGYQMFRRAHDGEPEVQRCRVEGESAYLILGVDPTASGEEIRRAYRVLARRHHPDNFAPEEKAKASDQLNRINRAYQILGDSDARFDYDMFVKSCSPDFPNLDEAYAFIEERRELLKEVIDVAELESETPEWSDEEMSPEDEEHAESMTPVPVQVPAALHDAAIQPLLSTEAAPGPPAASPRAGECAACGEPYQVQPGRTGPVYCERCGEELSRPE